MTADKPRLLFLHNGQERFVQQDLQLLQSDFQVTDFYMPNKFPQNGFKLWQAIQAADVIFIWFASWNAFWAIQIANLFNKKSVLVVGGYDTANLPIANYGSQRGGLTKWMSQNTMKTADLILPFSEYSRSEAHTQAEINLQKMHTVYLGVPDLFADSQNFSKNGSVLTVGNVEWANLQRKGLEPFVQTASRLPETNFILIGAWRDDSINYLKKIATPNVTFTGKLSDTELINYYREASVYVQASLHEGFGLSVAEAMLAECVPVVTKVGSLPEVVGECGIYADSPEPAHLATSIQQAFNAQPEQGKKARQRILIKFPPENRQKALSDFIKGLL